MMQDCYYIVTSSLPLVHVDAACKRLYGRHSTILGVTRDMPQEYRLELNMNVGILMDDK